MGCSACGRKYRSNGMSRTRFVLTPRRKRRTMVDNPTEPKQETTPVVQPQQEAPINIPEMVQEVDHATGTTIAVIKEGGFGERSIPDTLPQPEPVVIVDTPGPEKV